MGGLFHARVWELLCGGNVSKCVNLCRKSKVKLILKAQSCELLGEEEQIRA